MLLGGGWEDFDPAVRTDYRVVGSASELRSVSASEDKLLGLFRKPGTVTAHVRSAGWPATVRSCSWWRRG